MLTTPIILVGLITLVAIILFTTEAIRIDVTAFIVIVLLMLFGLVSPSEGLSGFSHVGTISVFALLFLSIGLESTGAVNFLVYRLEKNAPKNEVGAISLISVFVGITSAFLNNTAIVAIMLPVVVRLSTITKISVSKLLMPLSFAAMAGGCITIIGTSTNVIINGIYKDATGSQFSIFEFSLIGVILFCLYLAYILLLGRHLLPGNKESQLLTESYEVDKYLTQVKVLPGSPLIGTAISNDLHPKYGIRILEINREGDNVYIPRAKETIQQDDIMNIKTTALSLIEIESTLKLKVIRDTTLDDKELTSEKAVLFEAVIGNNSFLLGKRVRDIDFRKLFNAVPLAVRRSGSSLPTKVYDVTIQFGDTLLMEARRQNLDKFYNSRDFIVLEKVKKPNFRNRHMLLAFTIVFSVVLVAALGLLPLEVSALTGCAAMYLTGCVSPTYIYRKMDWKIIFLLAGMIPLGVAFQNSGASDYIVNLIMENFGSVSVRGIISVLFFITVLLTSFMSNNATAILIAPIAIALAQQMGLDPKMFLITVMFAASTSFLTPIGYQTNTLVYGPGKYKFFDYIKVGSLLTMIFWIAATFLIPWLYG